MADRWVLLAGGCYRRVSTQYGRQMDVIVRWFLLAGKYSRISGNMVDVWMLL